MGGGKGVRLSLNEILRKNRMERMKASPGRISRYAERERKREMINMREPLETKSKGIKLKSRRGVKMENYQECEDKGNCSVIKKSLQLKTA